MSETKLQSRLENNAASIERATAALSTQADRFDRFDDRLDDFEAATRWVVERHVEMQTDVDRLTPLFEEDYDAQDSERPFPAPCRERGRGSHSSY